MRESDGFRGIAATLESSMFVNHRGTVLSKQPFSMDGEFYEFKDNNIRYIVESLNTEENLQEKQQELDENEPKQNGSMDFSL